MRNDLRFKGTGSRVVLSGLEEGLVLYLHSSLRWIEKKRKHICVDSDSEVTIWVGIKGSAFTSGLRNVTQTLNINVIVLNPYIYKNMFICVCVYKRCTENVQNQTWLLFQRFDLYTGKNELTHEPVCTTKLHWLNNLTLLGQLRH